MAPREIDFSVDSERSGLGQATFELYAFAGSVALDAIEIFEEIEMPVRAPEFAVRSGLKAEALLFGNHFLNCAIFDLFELSGGEFRLVHAWLGHP